MTVLAMTKSTIMKMSVYIFFIVKVWREIFFFFILLFFQIGFTKTYISVKYAVVKKGARDFTLIDSSEMLQRYPLELFEFLKYRVEFLAANSHVTFGDVLKNNVGMIGDDQPNVLGMIFCFFILEIACTYGLTAIFSAFSLFL